LERSVRDKVKPTKSNSTTHGTDTAPLKPTGQCSRRSAEYAKFGGSPIDDQRCITAVLNNMDKIPDFAHACYKQRTTPLKDWSWEETKREFETAHKARIEKSTGDHGYHTANAASATDQKPAATDTPLR
jgi:hypothetical protein